MQTIRLLHSSAFSFPKRPDSPTVRHFVIIDMVFFDIVRQQPEKIVNFVRSGYADMRAYLFDSTVRGATMMTLVGGILGAIFGSVGGLVGNRKLTQERTT